MKPSEFELELIEKIIRARIRLEGLRKDHSENCPASDPLQAGSCRCGADTHNSKVNAVLKGLDIK